MELRNKVKCEGDDRLTPNQRGVFKKNKSIRVHKYLSNNIEEGAFKTDCGKINKVKRTKNGLVIEAQFRKRPHRYTKKQLVKILISAINLKKKNLVRLFASMLVANFSVNELRKMINKEIYFESPKVYNESFFKELIYLKMGKKYYRM